MLTVITPTGERPEAFALCQRMMERQTYKGDVRCIVVDDGETPQEITLSLPNWQIAVMRPEPFWQIGQNTQRRNLDIALSIVDEDREVVTVWEDDDYYAPGWLQWVSDNIQKAELIGECGAVYYNVRKRTWKALNNSGHACLRNSAMRGAAIKQFREVLETPDRYYDLKLWRAHGDKATFPRSHTLGLKGLPGRQGIAEGHDGLTGQPDPTLEKLREFIGECADDYAEFYEHAGHYEDRVYCLKPMSRTNKTYAVGEEFVEPLTPVERSVFVASGYLTRKTQRINAA